MQGLHLLALRNPHDKAIATCMYAHNLATVFFSFRYNTRRKKYLKGARMVP